MTSDYLLDIYLRSLWVSVSGALIALILGLLGVALLFYFRCKSSSFVVSVINGISGVPPIVVGLVVYLLISRQGLLGGLGILYTTKAMILAQAILALPFIISLVYARMHEQIFFFDTFFDNFVTSRFQRFMVLLNEFWSFIFLTFILALLRLLGEVGAIIIVGGNIYNKTRVMTGSIAMELSQGNVSFAVELGVMLVVTMLFLSFARAVLDRLFSHSRRAV